MKEIQDSLKYEHQAIKVHPLLFTDQDSYHWSGASFDILFDAGWIPPFSELRANRTREYKNGKIRPEFGLDGISYSPSRNAYYAIQMKKYSDPVGLSHLGSFYSAIYMRMKKKNPDNGGYLYTTSPLTKNHADSIRCADGDVVHIQLPFDDTETMVTRSMDKDESKCPLYPFQQDAVDAMLSSTNPNMLVSMPSGTGKTVVVGTYLKQVSKRLVIILSPTKILAEQNKIRMEKFLPQYNSELISSDKTGTRDVSEILELIDECKYGVLLSSTYKSVDVLKQVTHKYNGEMIIMIDECHNIDTPTAEFL